MRRLLILATILGLAQLTPAVAQKPKPPPKDKPILLVPDPFVIPPGKATKIKIRGMKLDEVTEAASADPKFHARLIGKPSTVGVDQKLITIMGDRQIEVEVTARPDQAGTEIPIIAINAAGSSSPVFLLVEEPGSTQSEKEPNNGFASAHAITAGQIIQGAIQAPQDVDVFRFEGQAGSQITILLQATRYGSPLDPMLTLYDGQGRTLHTSLDLPRGTHARLQYKLPRTGTYYAVIQEANDQGGSLFRYRVMIERGEAGK